jgi:glutamate-1-semialdehyde 2,1-aminomutase
MSPAQTHSQALFEAARALIPGGVNSPVRAFRGVGGEPRFIAKGKGARITDVDGRTYIDYVGSWGPLILGHAHPKIVAAVQHAAGRGTSYGAPTGLEVELARRITDAVPSIEMVRLVSSGTEATMSAIRLARGATGRDVVLKFEGGYHGHADSFLVEAGSGVATFGIPGSPGVPEATARLTRTLPYNDLGATRRLLEDDGKSIAAVIVEPVAGNMGVIPPAPGFLEGLREATREAGAVLIFDEVITGFRVAFGGAQALYGVIPDLTCIGKILGGGLPMGAFGGRSDLMGQVAPDGPVYQAGTLSGNPLAVAAGVETLKILERSGGYPLLEKRTAALVEALKGAADAAGVETTWNRVGSMFTGFFSAEPVTNFASAKRADAARYAAFFHEMLKRRVYLAPSAFEAAFVSLAHEERDFDQTVKAAKKAFQAIAAAPSRSD